MQNLVARVTTTAGAYLRDQAARELKNRIAEIFKPSNGWCYQRIAALPAIDERLFALGRCAVHFAVDEHEVRFCTHLQGKGSWFLPFNRGWNDGAGNPPNAGGLKTDYLWRRILTPDGLTEILEHYAQIVETRDERTRRKTRRQIWPRHHQLDVVRRLLADVAAHGAGRRYLVQHSAGSGKSNSIAWLAHRLIDVERNGARVLDSIVVVTDRRILDRQIRDTIRQYAQVGATVGHAARSGDLRRFLSEGKRIIVSTVQKFPIILDDIGNEHRRRRFAIVIDEAHSSQGGRTSASMSAALGAAGASDGDDSSKTGSTGSWSPGNCFRTRATSRSPPHPRTGRWRSSARRSRSRKARSGIGPSIATP